MLVHVNGHDIQHHSHVELVGAIKKVLIQNSSCESLQPHRMPVVLVGIPLTCFSILFSRPGNLVRSFWELTGQTAMVREVAS